MDWIYIRGLEVLCRLLRLYKTNKEGKGQTGREERPRGEFGVKRELRTDQIVPCVREQ